MFRGLAVLVAVVAASACTTAQPVDDVVPPTLAQPTDDTIEIGALPTQTLAAGECGLFLFAAKPTRRFVFFATAAGARALMKIDGNLIPFDRVAGTGQVIDQHFTEQSFIASAQNLSLHVSIDTATGAIGGTRIRGGSLRLSRDDGWSVVVPVGGATTCQQRGQ